MSMLRSETNDINSLIDEMREYFALTPARAEDFSSKITEYNFPLIVQYFDEELCKKSSIDYLITHPERANDIREINSQIMDVYVNTLTDDTNSQFAKIKLDQDNVEKSMDDLIALQASQVNYFTNLILTTVEKSQKDLMVERLIFTADKLIENGNYFAANSIYVGLMSPNVRILYSQDGEWAGLSKEALIKMRNLNDLFAEEKKQALVDEISNRNAKNKGKSDTSGVIPPIMLASQLLKGPKIAGPIDSLKLDKINWQERIETLEYLQKENMEEKYKIAYQSLKEVINELFEKGKNALNAANKEHDNLKSKTNLSDIEEEQLTNLEKNLTKINLNLSKLQNQLNLLDQIQNKDSANHETFNQLKKLFQEEIDSINISVGTQLADAGTNIKKQLENIYHPYKPSEINNDLLSTAFITDIEKFKYVNQVTSGMDTLNAQQDILLNKVSGWDRRISNQEKGLQSEENANIKNEMLNFLKNFSLKINKLNQDSKNDNNPEGMVPEYSHYLNMNANIDSSTMTDREVWSIAKNALGVWENEIKPLQSLQKEAKDQPNVLSDHYRSLKGKKVGKSRLLKSGLNITLPIEYKKNLSPSKIAKQDINILRTQVSKLVERIQKKLRSRNKLQAQPRIEKYMNELGERENDSISATRYQVLSVVMNKLNSMTNSIDKIKYLDQVIRGKEKIKLEDSSFSFEKQKHHKDIKGVLKSAQKKETSPLKLLKAYSHELAKTIAFELKNPKINVSALSDNLILEKSNVKPDQSSDAITKEVEKNDITLSTKKRPVSDNVALNIEIGLHIDKLNEMTASPTISLEKMLMLNELQEVCQSLKNAQSLEDIEKLQEKTNTIYDKYLAKEGPYAGFFDDNEKTDVQSQIEAVDVLIFQKESQINNTVTPNSHQDEVLASSVQDSDIKDKTISENIHAKPKATIMLEKLDMNIIDHIAELKDRNNAVYVEQAQAGYSSMKNIVDTLIGTYEQLLNAHNRHEVDQLHTTLNKVTQDYNSEVSGEDAWKKDEIIARHLELMKEAIDSKIDLLTPYDVKMHLETIDKAILDDINALEKQSKNFDYNHMATITNLLDLYDELLKAKHIEDTQILHDKLMEIKKEEGLNPLIYSQIDHMERMINRKSEQFKPSTYHPIKKNEYEEDHVSLKHDRLFHKSALLRGIGSQLKKAGSGVMNLGSKGIEKGIDGLKSIATKFKKD